MRKVHDLAQWMEEFASSRLAEDWDNVGLLWGDPAASVSKLMTCLTLTPTTAEEAARRGAELIVSHHPVLFRPVKAVRADDPENGALWALARANIALYSPHTAFDNCPGGINDTLAELLKLEDVGPLRPAPRGQLHKVVVFTPEADREAVLAAAFEAGAGRIGAYRECSFGSAGTGTFFGEDAANPSVGRKGRRESVAEWRLEVCCPQPRLSAVLDAVRDAHSYEEPAIDVYPLHDGPAGPGTGRVGRLASPQRLDELAEGLKRSLQARGIAYVGDPQRTIERVAIACGAGDEFVRDAARRADLLLTGEARYHRALEAERLGVALITAGHHATERIGVEALARRLSAAFPDLEVWASETERDPLRHVR